MSAPSEQLSAVGRYVEAMLSLNRVMNECRALGIDCAPEVLMIEAKNGAPRYSVSAIKCRTASAP